METYNRILERRRLRDERGDPAPVPCSQEEFAALLRELRDNTLAENGYHDTAQINEGGCGDFAHFALWETGIWKKNKRYSAWDDELDPTYPGIHVVIVFDGRYYDAECPDGCEDWRQLPIFQRFRSDPMGE